jgi:hypothetical protein
MKGMSIAIGGVALYNKAKFDAAKKKALYELPKTVKDGGMRACLLNICFVTGAVFGALVICGPGV